MKQNKQIVNYSMADMESVVKELHQIEWNKLLVLEDDTETAWGNFKRLILDIEKKCVPLKIREIKGRIKPFWLSNKAMKLVKKGIKYLPDTRTQTTRRAAVSQKKPARKTG